MANRCILHTSVTAEIKKRLKAAAASEFMTSSAWLRRLVIGTLGHRPETFLRRPPRERTDDLLDRRILVRIGAEDALLLKARALGRGMRPATYVSVLLRSHLRSLSPLPKEELLALKRTVSELGAVARDLNYLARRASQAGDTIRSGEPDLAAVLRLCEVLRKDTKALIKANINSWELGHEGKTRSIYCNSTGQSLN